MTGKEFRYVMDCIENEGFEYAFLEYSDYEDIKDEEFHILREAYIKAHKELAEYVGYEGDTL